MPVARRGPKPRQRRVGNVKDQSTNDHHNSKNDSHRKTGDAAQHACFSTRSSIHVTPLPTSPALETSALSSTSPGSWERALVLDPALSPHNSNSTPALGLKQRPSPLLRWRSLSRSLHLQDPLANLEQVVNRCFALFFEYLYPLTPLVHEPSLRDGLDFFVKQVSGANDPSLYQAVSATTLAVIGSTLVPGDQVVTGSRAADQAQVLKCPELWQNAMFTLITAVCAEAAFMLPQSIFPEGGNIAGIFLEASRDCLNSYLEADLEYPNANSISIRYFHSNCLHAAGKPKYSWHIFGEATRLAQVMQLHEESSFGGLLPIEAELRRRAFWILYVGDKSAAILNSRPITIHKFSFESEITTAYPTDTTYEMTASPSIVGVEDRSRSFIIGFNANLRLWQAASDLILEMRLLQNQKDTTSIGLQLLTTHERAKLDMLYVNFVTSLDDLPSHLQLDRVGPSHHEGSTQLKQYIIQCINLQVSLHCLRMVITQKFENLGFFTSGVEHTDMLLLRKTEIARDMLRVIREAPFWALQVNGEPCVSDVNPVLRDALQNQLT